MRRESPLAMPPAAGCLLVFAVFQLAASSQLASRIGDGAATQLLRHAAKYALAEPRLIEVLLKTTEEPELAPLASLDLRNRVSYRNVSVRFHHDAFDVTVEQFHMLVNASFVNVSLPLGLHDRSIHMDVQLPSGEVRVDMSSSTMTLAACRLTSPSLSAGASSHWMADLSASLLALAFSPALDVTLCAILEQHLSKLNHTSVMHFPVDVLLPPKARHFLARNETNLFYRLKELHFDEHQLSIRAQIEWNEAIPEYDETAEELAPDLSNMTSVMEMELRGDDEVTIWLEDGILNELISQVEWDFEWMQEAIPVTSPVIPADSRDFLSTLCSECYFLLNVSARGQPSIQATNNSLVLEKCDRVNLRVVNPDKNVTSVFVSFVLTIVAEMRPSFDNGIVRTLVQLLDTNIEMESGAFPKNWALFMQDLMRGMIMDMLWPEIKNAIEELSYGKGVRISKHCGIDPSELSIDIGEGNFSLTTRLALQRLDVERCVREIKASLPNTSKIFNSPIL